MRCYFIIIINVTSTKLKLFQFCLNENKILDYYSSVYCCTDGSV